MKRMQRFLRLASLLCLLTACATMQLAHMKQLQSTRQYEAIIAETPVASCNDPSQSREVCRQFYAIRGHAYLKLAMNESQPGAHCPMPTPSARANIDNAVHDYALASSAAARGSEDETHLLENQALALTCSAPFKQPTEAVAMTREAVAKLDLLPPNPSRALTASNAFLSLAQRTDLPQADRCQAARDARIRALGGLNGQPPATGEIAIRLHQTVNAAAIGGPGLPSTCV